MCFCTRLLGLGSKGCTMPTITVAPSEWKYTTTVHTKDY